MYWHPVQAGRQAEEAAQAAQQAKEEERLACQAEEAARMAQQQAEEEARAARQAEEEAKAARLAEEEAQAAHRAQEEALAAALAAQVGSLMLNYISAFRECVYMSIYVYLLCIYNAALRPQSWTHVVSHSIVLRMIPTAVVSTPCTCKFRSMEV